MIVLARTKQTLSAAVAAAASIHEVVSLLRELDVEHGRAVCSREDADELLRTLEEMEATSPDAAQRHIARHYRVHLRDNIRRWALSEPPTRSENFHLCQRDGSIATFVHTPEYRSLDHARRTPWTGQVTVADFMARTGPVWSLAEGIVLTDRYFAQPAKWRSPRDRAKREHCLAFIKRCLGQRAMRVSIYSCFRDDGSPSVDQTTVGDVRTAVERTFGTGSPIHLMHFEPSLGDLTPGNWSIDSERAPATSPPETRREEVEVHRGADHRPAEAG